MMALFNLIYVENPVARLVICHFGDKIVVNKYCFIFIKVLDEATSIRADCAVRSHQDYGTPE